MQPFANINQLWSRAIVDELARCGVRHAVISPGSRSTPLVLALAAHPDIADHSVIDERSAAFFALGLAKESGTPVALLCTSGTAAANYFPAVCEADASRVSLLMLTADRPAFLRDSGAPQTMDQVKLYGDRVRWQADTGEPQADVARLRALRSTVCQAVAMTRAPLAGPVHVNVPFDKPLEPTEAVAARDAVPAGLIETGGEAVHGREDGRPWLRVYHTSRSEGAVEDVADALLRAERPIVLAGPADLSDRQARALLDLAARHGIPVFAEAASQLRGFHEAPFCLTTLDLLLRSSAFRDGFDPDLVLQLGGVPTNAAAQRLLAEFGGAHLVVAPDATRRDAAHTARLHVADDDGEYLLRLSGMLHTAPSRKSDTTFLHLLRLADTAARAALDRLCPDAETVFEGAAIRAVLRALPEHAALFVSSSMPIRDLETFADALPQGCHVFYNRGVNGIDGVTSTALGVARTHGGPALLLTGDVAFLHNLNAAGGAGLRDIPLVVVLLNNDGGEIFDMLPIRDFDPPFTRHFLTPHGTDFAAACQAFGIPHRVAETSANAGALLREAFATRGLRVIEWRTSIAESGARRRALLRDVAAAVDEALAEVPPADSNEIEDSAPVETETPFLSDVAIRGRTPALAWRLLAEGEGPPAVLLHGFTRSSSSWKPLLPWFGGRPVIGIDLAGHGASPSPDPAAQLGFYGLEQAADAIAAIVARLGHASAHLVGYSLGGRTALHAALRHPELWRSLALLSANPGIEDERARATRREEDAALAERLGAIGLERFVGEWEAGPLFARLREADFPAWQSAHRDRLQRRTRGLQGSLLGSGQGAQRPLWDALEAPRLPVLVAAGREDGRYADIATRLAALLHDAELRVYDGAGHDLPTERPREIGEAIAALWKRAEGRALL